MAGREPSAISVSAWARWCVPVTSRLCCPFTGAVETTAPVGPRKAMWDRGAFVELTTIWAKLRVKACSESPEAVRNSGSTRYSGSP